jgi:flagellar protein FliO/FliZ
MGDASLLAVVARVVVSLGVVLALMAGAALVMRRRGVGGLAPAGPGRRRQASIEILARSTLGRSTSLALVRAGGRALVLGVTETQVTLLLDSTPEELDLDTPEAPRTVQPVGAGKLMSADGSAQLPTTSSAWTAALEALRDRTARRS